MKVSDGRVSGVDTFQGPGRMRCGPLNGFERLRHLR
jgi:hypothetical protein